VKVKLYQWWNTKNQKWGVREVKVGTIVRRASAVRQNLSVAPGSIRIAGDLSAWTNLDLFDHAGRHVSALPVESLVRIPAGIARGVYRVRLSGPKAEEDGFVLVP